MKKLYRTLFANENYVIAASLMSIIYVVAHLFIRIGFIAQGDPSFNATYLTIDAPASLIYQLEKIEWLQWATLILGICIYIAYVVYNAGLGSGEGDKSPGYMFIFCALIVIAGFFPAIFAQNKEMYRKKVDEATFHYYKSNPEKVIELWNINHN